MHWVVAGFSPCKDLGCFSCHGLVHHLDGVHDDIQSSLGEGALLDDGDPDDGHTWHRALGHPGEYLMLGVGTVLSTGNYLGESLEVDDLMLQVLLLPVHVVVSVSFVLDQLDLPLSRVGLQKSNQKQNTNQTTLYAFFPHTMI